MKRETNTHEHTPNTIKKARRRAVGLTSLLAAGLFAFALTASAHVPVTQCPPVCQDFMTGGGWIPLYAPLCNNPKGTFGFVGGLNAKGEFFGSANYIDHCTGDHAKGDDVIAYCFIPGTCPDPDTAPCRRIVYTGRFNNVPGYTIVLDVCDNGEPGRDDTFSIRVLIRSPLDPGADCDPKGTQVYAASGTLGGGGPGGGNIQIHRHCK
jgi:hypothetical protein